MVPNVPVYMDLIETISVPSSFPKDDNKSTTLNTQATAITEMTARVLLVYVMRVVFQWCRLQRSGSWLVV